MTAPQQIKEALFRPRSIALVGASADETKHASLAHQFLRRHGYTGEIFPVNAVRETVFGDRAYRRVSDVGAPIDHAFVMLPTEAVLDAVSDCCRANVKCVTVLSNGFAEQGEEGRRRQAALVEMVRDNEVRLLGPNSLGMINLRDRVALSASEILAAPELNPGRCSLISQSGSLMGALLSRGQARGIGFSKLISVGNEADLGVAEMGEMLIDDPDTDAILFFLETVRDADAMASMARRAFAVGKPVVALRVGTSAVGEQLAASHTGALMGSGAALEEYLRDIGVIRIDTLDGLLEVVPLVRGKFPPRGRRVHIVSTTGGGGALVVDAVSAHGVEVNPPPQETVDRLAQAGIAIRREPLIDLTLAGTNPKTYGAVLRELLASPECDLVVAVAGSSSQFRPERVVTPIVAAVEEGGKKPVAVFLTPAAQNTLTLLAEAGVAGFRTPESCADAVRAYLQWRPPSAPVRVEVPDAARAALDAAGAARSLDAVAAGRVFAALGVPMLEERVLPRDPDDWPQHALEGLAFPVAAKIHSPDIAHKTEVGGVEVGIKSQAELLAAARRIVARVRDASPTARILGLQVQPLASGLAESILGFRRDPAVGPTVLFGAGGVLSEIYRDIAIRRAPIDERAAMEMIEEVRGLAMVRGYRGLPRGDLRALARAIAAFSRLAELDVAEAEINPLLIRPEGQGVVGVDAVLSRGGADEDVG